MVERLSGLVMVAAMFGCGGGGTSANSTDMKAPGGGTQVIGGGSSSDQAPASGSTDGAGEAATCQTGYDEFERAWSVWFQTELEDAEAAAVVTEEWIKQLPMKSELQEMAQVAEELRYEPGFDLWIVALNATEEAIGLCGEGAANPG